MEIRLDRSNWRQVRLGDVASEYSKRVNNPSESGFERFVGNSNIGQWDFRIKAWDATDSVTSAMKLFERGDYLLVRRSLYASDFRERAPRADFEGVCSGDILTIRENPEEVSDGFLIGVLNSPALWKYVVANASGSITRRIKWRDLANYEFLLPPKVQQTEIAELLWAVDDLLQRQYRVATEIRTLQSSILKQKCLLSPDQTEFRVSDLLAEKPRNGYSPKTSSEPNGAKTVSISAVKDGLFSPEGNEKYAVVSEDVLEKFNVLAGDIFVVRGNGNKNLCGLAGLASQAYEGMFYPDLLIRLRFDPEKLLPKLAVRIWNSPGAHQSLLRWAKSTNGIWKVNGEDIKRHRINIPERAKQPEIVAELERFDELHCQAIAAYASSRLFQKSLIAQVF